MDNHEVDPLLEEFKPLVETHPKPWMSPLAGPLPASLSLPYLVQGGAHLVTTLGRTPQGVWGTHGVAFPMHPMT